MSLHLVALGLTFSAALSSGGPCPKTRLGPHVAAQPEAWRKAVDALVASTTTPGLPWSCVGGEVDLVARGESAELTVTGDDGVVITREVAAPEEVQPLGEALLAKPLPPPAPAVPATPRPTTTATPVPDLPPPRVLLSASIGPRYVGPDRVLLGGVGLGAALPFGRWGGGLWIRFDGIAKRLDERSVPLRQLGVGASAFRGFDVGPLTLRAALRPALAVVTRLGDRGTAAETRYDFRLGVEAQVVIPFHRTFRGFVGLDGDFSPVELARPRKPAGRDREAPFPKVTTGLAIGVEVAIR